VEDLNFRIRRSSSQYSDPVLKIGHQGTGYLYMGEGFAGGWPGAITETGSGDYPTHMVVRGTSDAIGVVQGYGTIMMEGDLENNGLVAAYGYGTQTDLNLSNFDGGVTSAIENEKAVQNGQYGWLAMGLARLYLPAISVGAGSGAYNWGEDPSDSEIDLRNSARMDFDAVGTSGYVALTLYDPARSDVPAGLSNVVGMWSAEAYLLDFDSVDLTFRYDDIMADFLGLTQDDLDVYYYVNGDWLAVTSGIDTANYRIHADDITSFSWFAVAEGGQQGAIPEPISMIFFGTGLTGVIGFAARRKMQRGS